MKKMKVKNILIVATLILSSIGCVNANNNSNTAKGYTVNATTDAAENKLVILSKITDKQLVILDSTYVAKGSFSFKGETADESELHFITFSTTQPPGIPIILENGAKLDLNITGTGTYNVTMSGGKYTPEMLKLYNVYTGYEKEMAKFNAEIAALDPSSVTEEVRRNTNVRYTTLIQQRSKNIEDFIRNEKATPATYFAVKYLFNKPEPRLIMLASKKMGAELPDSKYTKSMQATAKQLGPLVEGAMAPDIKLKTPAGDSLALSSLRGKVVLIDFWASWCGPCRRENPNVKKIYEKYKDQGFEIYGVSLDNNASRWNDAIAKDGLTWKHVSDLAGWQSSAAKLYGVRSIPATFLLDKEGRIYKSGFRSHELEGLLQQLLTE
ncbi:MAG: AhpC/TSA family protein [Bacteroidetes bacterium]|nr:AhpC/TSA family protein [Bacteroidota bacterium]